VAAHQPRIGLAAEDFVAARLVEEGWDLLDRRWRGASGELDLVVHRAGQLRFVEVKAREPGDSTALESIDGRKQARLIDAAEAWTDTHPPMAADHAFLVALVTLHPAGWTVEWLDDAL
jgi:putative endonuclease